jgi:hypothetical protein
MSELAELLELLHEVRHRYRTARGIVRRRYSLRLTQEAIKRANARTRRRAGGTGQVMMFSTRRGGTEPKPAHIRGTSAGHVRYLGCQTLPV